MLPIRDLNPTRSRPVLTYLLIAVNTLVYAWQFTLSPAQEQAFVLRFGLVPALISNPDYLPGPLITPLTSMFMHGGLLHLLANMWSLFIFGDNVEDILGKARFALFYLVCGLGAAAAQVLIDPSSTVPMVGASGAIAGVLAAYLRFFPRARVVVLIPIFIFALLRELPAIVFIVLWFAFQLLSGLGALGASESAAGGVAVFAHIGGFVVGLMLAILSRARFNSPRGFRPPPRY